MVLREAVLAQGDQEAAGATGAKKAPPKKNARIQPQGPYARTGDATAGALVRGSGASEGQQGAPPDTATNLEALGKGSRGALNRPKRVARLAISVTLWLLLTPILNTPPQNAGSARGGPKYPGQPATSEFLPSTNTQGSAASIG